MKFFLLLTVIGLLSVGNVFAQKKPGFKVRPAKPSEARLYPLCDAKASNKPCYYKPKPGSDDVAGVVD